MCCVPVISSYLGALAEEVFTLGIPHNRIFTHTAASFDQSFNNTNVYATSKAAGKGTALASAQRK
jgi:hypothetical protein